MPTQTCLTDIQHETMLKQGRETQDQDHITRQQNYASMSWMTEVKEPNLLQQGIWTARGILNIYNKVNGLKLGVLPYI